MLSRLPCSAQNEYANRTFFFHCTALMTVLSWLLLFNACGASAPGSTTPTNTSGSNSTPNLTISATLPPASVGSNYNATVTVTGGTAPYAFSIASGALPKCTAPGRAPRRQLWNHFRDSQRKWKFQFCHLGFRFQGSIQTATLTNDGLQQSDNTSSHNTRRA